MSIKHKTKWYARLIFINGRLYKYHKYIGSFVYQDILLPIIADSNIHNKSRLLPAVVGSYAYNNSILLPTDAGSNVIY